jgi:hypothetical protein
VGNGESIQIWKDRWVSRSNTFQITTPPRILDPEATVSELFQEGSSWWNTQLLHSIFPLDEVQLILSIPLGSKIQQDTLLWRGTTNGLFSVRSAYFIQQEIVNRGRPKLSPKMVTDDY